MKRLLLTVTVLSALSGCHRHAATTDECNAILDRIVELELHELGFRDPALTTRKESELRRTLGQELDRCAGVQIREGAIACVRQAASVEEISHRCLR